MVKSKIVQQTSPKRGPPAAMPDCGFKMMSCTPVKSGTSKVVKPGTKAKNSNKMDIPSVS